MPNKWHIFKEGQAGNKNRQHRGLLVFSELPSLPSAGSRPGCFHTSLGCKPRSLIRVSLGWFDYSKRCEEGQSNSQAYSPVSDRRRLTALVEVHWAENPLRGLFTHAVDKRDLVADRNQWRAICGSKTPSTTKGTPTFSRQDL
jgi:hypothetical protein